MRKYIPATLVAFLCVGCATAQSEGMTLAADTLFGAKAIYASLCKDTSDPKVAVRCEDARETINDMIAAYEAANQGLGGQ
jgi:uncharacterized protein YcfL